jgi:hypothetical protein
MSFASSAKFPAAEDEDEDEFEDNFEIGAASYRDDKILVLIGITA